MRLSDRVRKLEAKVPRCNGRVSRIARAGELLTEEDCCRVCGGCHVFVIKEVVERGSDGRLVPVGGGDGGEEP
jgi:hypothetical protein